MPFQGIENLHITTFKSAKGLEFDTVIIPDFQNYDWNIKNLDKAPITENDYYVAITRARRNLMGISKKSFFIALYFVNYIFFRTLAVPGFFSISFCAFLG